MFVLMTLHSQDCQLESKLHIDLLKEDTTKTEFFKDQLIVKRINYDMKSYSHDREEYFHYDEGILYKKEDKYIFKFGKISIDSFIYEYNNGQLAKETEYRSDSSPFTSKIITTYAYNGDTTLVEKSYNFATSVTYFVDDVEDGFRWWFNNFDALPVRKLLDQNDNELLQEHKKDNKWNPYSRTEYTYDECDNITEEIEKSVSGEILKHNKIVNIYSNKK